MNNRLYIVRKPILLADLINFGAGRYMALNEMCMKNTVLILIIFSLLYSGCRRDPLRVDISGIDNEVRIIRFDSLLFSLHPDSISRWLPKLSEDYGAFLERFSYVINIGSPGDPGYEDYLHRFLSDSMIREVYGRTQEVFPGLEWLEAKFSRAFRHYLYYFPGREVPQIYSYISGFNHSLIIDEGILGIGLDKYLGKSADYYQMLALPVYMKDKMHPGKIASDCMYYWASTEFPYNDSVDNVLTNMIHEGQLLYFTKAMMPREPDSLIMGYSPGQMKWVQENERAMYDYLVENKLLFDNKRLTISKLVRDAPFTQLFSTDSPGRTGSWLGWQIVRSFMQNNPEIGLPELMEETDYRKVFSGSRYRPR